MTTVSLIIPFYNTHLEYFNELVDDLLKLDKKYYQIILINDGSDDPRMIKYIKEKELDKHFELINKNHEGVSAARNAGIKAAKNDYVMFIDSDDLVNFNLLNYFVERNISQDVVFFHFARNNLERDNQVTFIDIDDSIEYLYEIDRNLPENKNFYYRSACSKLFKTSITKYIKFHENIVYCEDCIYCGEIYDIAKNFLFINSPNLYFYRQNLDSQTRKFDIKFIERYDAFFNKFIELNFKIKGRIKFLMYDTIAIHLNVRVCMSLKSFHFLFAYKFVKSNSVKQAAKYFIENPTLIQKHRVNICKKIHNKHYLTAIVLIVFNRIKVKFGLVK